MRLHDLRRSGHTPSLAAALIHFDVSFMCWVLLGALGAFVAEDLGLSPAAKGLDGRRATALGGRLPPRARPAGRPRRAQARRHGQHGARLAPLLWGWLAAGSLPQVLAVGMLLGVAGASFAIALPLASRWYPPRLQGLAMGIAGAGNSGTVIATLAAPRLAERMRLARGDGHGDRAGAARARRRSRCSPRSRRGPAQAADREAAWRRMLREPDARRLAGLYAVTFGGFVGLASFLPILLHDQYGLTKVAGRDDRRLRRRARLAAAPGRRLRRGPRRRHDRAVGRAGRRRRAAAVRLRAAAGRRDRGRRSSSTMGALGVGNGAVFQLVGLRFGERIGAMTGHRRRRRRARRLRRCRSRSGS